LLINNGVQLYSWKSWLTNASCVCASQVFALAVAGNPTGEALQGANLQIHQLVDVLGEPRAGPVSSENVEH
jgi:hypothetical protein